jgi:hypothetical protein
LIWRVNFSYTATNYSNAILYWGSIVHHLHIQNLILNNLLLSTFGPILRIRSFPCRKIFIQTVLNFDLCLGLASFYEWSISLIVFRILIFSPSTQQLFIVVHYLSKLVGNQHILIWIKYFNLFRWLLNRGRTLHTANNLLQNICVLWETLTWNLCFILLNYSRLMDLLKEGLLRSVMIF